MRRLFGAEIIKIEKPGLGDPLRAFGTPATFDAPSTSGTPANGSDTLCWLSEARNKQSITLDLSQDKGADLLRQLVRQSDVIRENFRPGTLEKWGLGFDRLLEENPRLIMLRVSGFGQTGPLKDRPSFARIAHAFGGLAHLTGTPGGPPLTPGSTSLADYISGLYGAIGILVALAARDRVGGQTIDLALYESIFRVLDDIAPTYAQNGTVRDRLGVGASNACPHGHFQAKDERWVSLACSSDKIFERFARLIGRSDLARPDTYGQIAARLENKTLINNVTAEWIATLTAQEVVETCTKGDVPCALIHTIADIFESPQFAARENLVSISGADHADCVVPNVIPKLSKTPGRIDHLGPTLGEDNGRLRNLLGLSAVEMEQLKQEKVI